MIENRTTLIAKALRLEGETLAHFSAELKKLSESEKDELAALALAGTAGQMIDAGGMG